VTVYDLFAPDRVERVLAATSAEPVDAGVDLLARPLIGR